MVNAAVVAISPASSAISSVTFVPSTWNASAADRPRRMREAMWGRERTSLDVRLPVEGVLGGGEAAKLLDWLSAVLQDAARTVESGECMYTPGFLCVRNETHRWRIRALAQKFNCRDDLGDLPGRTDLLTMHATRIRQSRTSDCTSCHSYRNRPPR